MPQSLSQVILHVIFSTADRKCWLADTIRDHAQGYIATLLRDADSYSWKSTRWNMMNVRSGIEEQMKRSFRAQYLFLHLCPQGFIPARRAVRNSTLGSYETGPSALAYSIH